MTEKTLKLPSLARDLCADIALRAEDKTTRLTFAASSETPVERYFGDEVLSHDKGAIRLDRVKRGAMPLLFNHNWDEPIGMIDAARVEDARLMVDAHLFETPRAAEVGAMLAGGLRNVSIGYRLHTVEEDKKTGTITARDWEPYECSIVSIPADSTVGIGRGFAGGEALEVRMLSTPAVSANLKGVQMDTKQETVPAANSGEVQVAAPAAVSAVAAAPAAPSALQLEQSRRRAIENLCKANKLDENMRDMWIGQGISLEAVSDDILRVLEERGRSNPQPASKIGMTVKETSRFSLSRAITACAGKDWTNAGFELECSRAVAAKLNQVPNPNRFYVPFEVLQRPVEQRGQRDLTVASAGAGGYLVETQNMGFIEILRNRSVAFRMGARRLSGLVGSVTVPRQSVAGTPVWLANEASTATESTQTFVQMALSPKTVGAYTEISRQLLLQSSPGVEGIVTDDLAQVVAIAADLAVLEGTGSSGQPTGISATSGIGSVTGTSIAYAGILEFQTDVAGSNVMPARGGYVTTPTVAALLMGRQRFSSTDTPLWQGNVWDGQMSGFPAMSTNQVTAATMVFGDWNEVVVGEWGVLEVEVNPYANFQAGIVGVRALYSLDVGVRRPFAFSRATSIT